MRGTIIYDLGADAVRDDGESFRVGTGATLETDIMALRLAQRRFGNVIIVDGDDAFRRRMVKAAVEGKVFIKFADPRMERQRNERFQGLYQERKEHENGGRESSNDQGKARTDTSRTTPYSWLPAALEDLKRARNDGQTEMERPESDTERDKPSDRGMSR